MRKWIYNFFGGEKWLLSPMPWIAILSLNLVATVFTLLVGSGDIALIINAIGVTLSIRLAYVWYAFRKEHARYRKRLEEFLIRNGSQILKEIDESHRNHSDESNSDKT